ncbi:cation diffusion facilitator family transporter [Chloroflexota bacterium]
MSTLLLRCWLVCWWYRLTGLNILDPIIALIVSLFILKVAYDVLRKSFGGLIDVSLSEAEENVVRLSIANCDSELTSYHTLRTRKSGNQRYIDLHLVISKNTSVEDTNQLCDCLEQNISQRLHYTNVTIHVEPGYEGYDQCHVNCSSRQIRD